MRSAGVYGISGILPFLRAAYTRRVDVLQIMDSNGAQNTITGHFEGQTMALANVFGLYGTAFCPGVTHTVLQADIAGHTAGTLSQSSPPDAFTSLRFPALGADAATRAFSDFAWGNTFIDNTNPGHYLQIKHRFPMDLNGAIEYCPVFWKPTASGITKFKPSVIGLMDGGPAFGQLYRNTTGVSISGGVADVNSTGTVVEGKWSIARGTLIDLTNATSPAVDSVNGTPTTSYLGQGLKFSPSYYTGTGNGMDGSNTGGLLGHRVCDAEKFNGVAVTPFYQYGGKPTRQAAWDICGVSPTDAAYTSKGAWTASTAYSVNDTVTDGGETYICVSAHTSSAAGAGGNEPGVGATWTTKWNTPGGMTDAALATYLQALVRSQRNSNGQTLSPMALVQIIEGGNDAGDTGTLGALSSGKSLLSTTGAYRSATQQANAGNTATGYFNNTVSIMRRIRYVWETVLGYPRAGLYFLIGCYHPQTSGISSAQWTFCGPGGGMTTGGQSVVASEPNCCYVDGYKLGSFAEFGRVVGNTSGGVDGTDYQTAAAQSYSTTASPFTAVAHQPWYRDPSSQDAHLNQQGYIQWGIRVWQAVMDSAWNNGLMSPLLVRSLVNSLVSST